MRRTFIFGFFVRSFCTDATKKRRLAAIWAQTIQAEIIHIHKQKQRNLFQQKLRKLQIPDQSQSPVEIKNRQDTQTKDNLHQSQSFGDINREQNNLVKDNQSTQAKDVAHQPQAPNEIKLEKEIALIDHLREINLPDSIRNYLHNQRLYSQTQLDQGKNEFMKIFNPFEGVKLPNELSAVQQRFLQAINKRGNIAFYPTSLITTKIFVETQKQMRNYSRESKTIFVGKPGISKSMSLLFYWYLSYVNAAFRYQFPKQSKELIQLNMLKPVGYKILYFNYNAEKFKQQDYIELILSQCPEIQKQFSIQIKGKPNSLEQTLRTINKVYKKKQIKCFVIADQLNAAARIFKQYNSKLKDVVQNKTTGQLSTIANQQLSELSQTALLLSRVHFAIRNTIPRIYNSSSNIQPSLLGKKIQNQHIYLALCMSHHTKQTTIPIQYDESTTTLSQLKEIYRFIWYGIANLLPSQTADDKNRNKQKEEVCIKICDRLAVESGFSTFITPLSIQYALTQFLKIRPISSIQWNNQSSVYRYINEFYQMIFDSGMKILVGKSFNFLKDSLEKQKKIKVNIVLTCLGYLAKNPTATEIPLSYLKEYGNLQKYQIQVAYDKDIFALQPYFDKQYKLKYKLKLLISNKQFQILSKRWLLEISSDQNYFSVFQMFIKRHPGFYFEFAVTQILKQNNNATIIFGLKSYPYIKTQYFKHFLGNYPSVLSNILQIYKLAFESNNKYYFGIPLTPLRFEMLQLKKDIKPQQLYSQNNPSIDFLGILKNQSKECQIVSFDLTITNSIGEINSKLKKADQFLKIKLNQNYYFVQSDYEITQQAKTILAQLRDSTELQEFKQFVNTHKQVKKSNKALIIQIQHQIKKSTKLEQAKNKIINLLVKKSIIQITSECKYFKHLKKWKHVIVAHIKDQTERQKNFELPLAWKTESGIEVSYQVNSINSLQLGTSEQKGIHTDTLLQGVRVILQK